MGFIRGLIRFCAAIVIISIGVLFVMYDLEELVARAHDVYMEFLDVATPIPIEGVTYRQVFGVAMALFGALLLWMVIVPKRRRRSVSFVGTHGEVTIELEPVEATLQRVAMKLPEVKNMSITLRPLEGNGRIKVEAVAILEKSADDDARMVTARVQNFLQIHTRKIVGLQDVETKLTVTRWNMRMKTVKPEPLLLESTNESATTVVNAQSTHIPTPPVAEVPVETTNSVELDRGAGGEISKF
ncbi:MAG: hypothetical protein VCD00_05075 [Candidatus Hydrogenedentota bacterium]